MKSMFCILFSIPRGSGRSYGRRVLCFAERCRGRGLCLRSNNPRKAAETIQRNIAPQSNLRPTANCILLKSEAFFLGLECLFPAEDDRGGLFLGDFAIFRGIQVILREPGAQKNTPFDAERRGRNGRFLLLLKRHLGKDCPAFQEIERH